MHRLIGFAFTAMSSPPPPHQSASQSIVERNSPKPERLKNAGSGKRVRAWGYRLMGFGFGFGQARAGLPVPPPRKKFSKRLRQAQMDGNPLEPHTARKKDVHRLQKARRANGTFPARKGPSRTHGRPPTRPAFKVATGFVRCPKVRAAPLAAPNWAFRRFHQAIADTRPRCART